MQALRFTVEIKRQAWRQQQQQEHVCGGGQGQCV